MAKTIDEQVAAYRNALVRRRVSARADSTVPPEEKSAARLGRIRESLTRIQVRLAAADERRVRILVQELRLHLDTKDFRKVHAVAEEISHMARLLVLGMEGEHPMLVSTIPPAGPTPVISVPMTDSDNEGTP